MLLRYKIFIAFLFFSLTLTLESAYADSVGFSQGSNADLFSRGSRLLSMTAGRSFDTMYGRISLLQLNVNEYILDNLAIHYGATFGYADTKRTKSGVCGGPELGIRLHFLKNQRLSTYAEASIAASFYQYPVKEGTLKFNFDLQPGVGATYRITDNAHVRGGMRWHHLSNARIGGGSRNYGYDGVMFYFGMMRVFE
jgi:hypothetical protein